MAPPARIVPALRYADGRAAVEWLSRAFGFEPGLVVPDDDRQVVHAQLHFGNSMVMLGTERPGDFDQWVKPPKGREGVNTQSAYVIVEDADAHHARAAAAGAKILMPVEDEDHGGRAYTCRDPEGHVWTFGTYDPWAG